MTVLLLVVAGLAAVGDWAAVRAQRVRVEYLLKPATLALLIAAAATADLGDARPWVVAALAFGLVGDVALLAAGHPAAAASGPAGGLDAAFLAGLGAFLVGHVSWIVAFSTLHLHLLAFAAALLVAIGIGGLVLGPVLAAVHRQGGAVLAAIVAGYAVLLGATAAFAAGTGAVATGVGGVLFLVSDAVLARERFVARVPYGRLLVILTYHLAQGLMLIGLIRSY